MDLTRRPREGEQGVSPLLRRARCRGVSGAACAAAADPRASVLPATPGWGVASDLALRLGLPALSSLGFPCDKTVLFHVRKPRKGVSRLFSET